jgi:hypothetical protein
MSTSRPRGLFYDEHDPKIGLFVRTLILKLLDINRDKKGLSTGVCWVKRGGEDFDRDLIA